MHRCSNESNWISQKVEIAIADIPLTAERQQFVEYTQPFLMDDLAVVVSRKSHAGEFQKFRRTEDPTKEESSRGVEEFRDGYRLKSMHAIVDISNEMMNAFHHARGENSSFRTRFEASRSFTQPDWSEPTSMHSVVEAKACSTRC